MLLSIARSSGEKAHADIGIRHQRIGEILAEPLDPAMRRKRRTRATRRNPVPDSALMFRSLRTTALVR